MHGSLCLKADPRLQGAWDLRVILGLYGDNGKENGNYYNGLYKVWGLGFGVQGSGSGGLGSRRFRV